MEPEKENNKKYMDEQTNFGENRGDTRIKLKILKNGKPINNVFIGEKLLAVVESNSALNREWNILNFKLNFPENIKLFFRKNENTLILTGKHHEYTC